MEMSNEKIQFRYLDEAEGGTFRFDPNGSPQERIAHVGTDKCISCVGVFLPINDDRYFAAHILGYVEHRSSEGEILRKRMSLLAVDECNRLRTRVREMLEAEALENDWSKEDVRSCVEDGTRQMVIVCPRMYDVAGRPGHPVIQAVGDFLAWDLMLYWKSGPSGFIIDYRGEQSLYIYPTGEAHEDLMALENFEAVPEPGRERPWEVGVDPEDPSSLTWYLS